MTRLLAPLALLLALATPPSAAAPSGPAIRAEQIPPRPHHALTGSEFGWLTADADDEDRRAAVLAEALSGNVPDFLRAFLPLQLSELGASGRRHEITLWVAPDYLALGGDDDFLRVPMDFLAATRVADRFGCVLPTPKMVDLIYQSADVKLAPAPLPPGPDMRTSAYTIRHRQLLSRQLPSLQPGALVAGHKKDVVISQRLNERPGRVAIYGWHQPDGEPIQTLSVWHGALYADYSHGVRLVHETVWIDGAPLSLYEALGDPELAPIFSDEGPIDAWSLMHPDPGLARL